MKPIKPSEKLPKNNEYVLAFFSDSPWQDKDANNNGHKWVVVKFIRGISKKERGALADGNRRKSVYASEDECWNNEKPYYWDVFGPGSFFGQDAKLWCHLPKSDI